jgi:hypothetical protein
VPVVEHTRRRRETDRPPQPRLEPDPGCAPGHSCIQTWILGTARSPNRGSRSTVGRTGNPPDTMTRAVRGNHRLEARSGHQSVFTPQMTTHRSFQVPDRQARHWQSHDSTATMVRGLFGRAAVGLAGADALNSLQLGLSMH